MRTHLPHGRDAQESLVTTSGESSAVCFVMDSVRTMGRNPVEYIVSADTPQNTHREVHASPGGLVEMQSGALAQEHVRFSI